MLSYGPFQISYIFHFLDDILVLDFEQNRSVNRVEWVKLFHQALKRWKLCFCKLAKL